jgi:zinc protease
VKRSLILTFLAAAAAFGQTAATQQKLPRIEDLKFPALREVQIPEVPPFTLPNGMKVYLLENHELPLVSGTALVRTGNLFDPPDKVGLAGLTGSVMRTGGTKTRTGDQLDATLESMAASVEASIGETSGSVSFNALKENTDEVLALFRDVLTNPEFRQDRLDLAKTQSRSAISRRNDDADGISDREFASIVYGRNTPYGWDETYEALDNINREDLQAFYKRYFFPANIRLAISGDFKTSEMRAKLEKLFADWTVKGEPVPPFPQVQPQPKAPGVYQGTKSEVTQTFFDVGHLAGKFSDKDYPALSVMSDILGGGFASRLFLEVRTRKGLAYSVGGGWGATYDHPGLFRIGGSTKSASTVDALKAIREEVDKIRTSEVTDQELQTAKGAVLNSFVFNFDHPRKVLSRVVTYDYYGYPKDFIFQYQKGVEAATKADVLRVAKEHLHPGQFTIVAVGNPKEFGAPLSALGKVNELDLTIPEPGAKNAKAADPASLAKGKALLQKAQQAMGGADKLAAVKDITHESDLTIAQNGMKVKQIVQYVAPDVLRAEQTLPFGKVTSVWNGKEGWLVTPQGTMAMPPPVVNQVRSEMFRVPVKLFLADRDPESTVSALTDNTVEISNKSGQRVKVEFDTATGLPSRETYTSQGQTGPTEVTAILSDWRDADGIKVPHHITIEQGGKKFGESVTASVKVNAGLNAAEVGKKP